AAGYDPLETFAVTYKTYVHSPTGKATLHSESTRTYAAWEIAAGMWDHDRPGDPGVINSVDTEYASPQAKRKVLELAETGKKLQASWQNDVSGPIRVGTHGSAQIGFEATIKAFDFLHPSGAKSLLQTWEHGKNLNRRSGQADAYSVRATLQSLRDSPTFLTSLNAEGQDAVRRTLTQNGQVIIPNIYGYPMEGFAFIPYGPPNASAEHRPNQGLLLDLRTGKVAEIRGDDDFARWAEKNRSRVMLSFNAEDMQGDPHRLGTWPAADFLMSKLTEGTVKYQGVPVRELFNYNRSDSDHMLKRGTLDTIAQQYEAVNTKYTSWLDQTQVFGASQQRWKAWKEVWDKGPAWIPIIGNVGNLTFGIHDSEWGPTVEERSGGSFAAFLAALQLAHEAAPGGEEAGESAAAGSRPQPYAWTYHEAEREYAFGPRAVVPKAEGAAGGGLDAVNEPAAQAEPTPPANNNLGHSVGGATVLSDLGKEIDRGGGGEAIVYESRDGKSVYKAFDGNNATKTPQFVTDETGWLNKYYGENFAQVIFEDGKSYIKMPKLDGKPLSDFGPRSLPANVTDLLKRVLEKMEKLGIHHQDLQLKTLSTQNSIKKCIQ
ncbi:OspG family effector kinase, partial [Pseudomonas fluorescens]|uniref:OspG family effector kinase n=1 Tax=Pseudomonas fluorescens TaxID=294 RepID=UPI001BECC11A